MGSVEVLSVYRYKRAMEDLEAAKELFRIGMLKASLNRSYYAIFHAMRALTALKGFDSSKHSGIIAYFNKNFVKNGIFDKETSKIIKNASILREQSDYSDFYIVSRFEVEQQIEAATKFIMQVSAFLKENRILE